MAKKPGQREANREAMEMAASMVENSDFEQLFGDLYTGEEKNDDMFLKAQRNAVRRIRSLINHKER
jgi:hypothetical protein